MRTCQQCGFEQSEYIHKTVDVDLPEVEKLMERPGDGFCIVGAHIAPQTAELAATVPAVVAANTASPKFPSSTDVWNNVLDAHMYLHHFENIEECRKVAKICYEFIARKLRA
jgi:hypothetical protein